MAGLEVWREFEHDPRARSNAELRASDRDREIVQTVLGDAFAEGRLSRSEYDERSEGVLAARTLGELPVFVQDLPVASPAQSRTDSIPERAQRAYVRERRQAEWAFISASLICWVIWVATNLGDGQPNSIPWPVFVMLGTALNVGRVMFQKGDIIESETRRLEKKQRKQLE